MKKKTCNKKVNGRIKKYCNTNYCMYWDYYVGKCAFRKPKNSR